VRLAKGVALIGVLPELLLIPFAALTLSADTTKGVAMVVLPENS